MKKIFLILLAGTLIYSCGSNESEKKAEETKPADTSATTPAPATTDETSTDKGLELIGSNDCITCHSIDKKIVGPAYKDVAMKYENTPAVIDTLVAKVKKGGMGNWGNIPMMPHPNLTDADAREMIKYILSLRNK